MLHCPTGLGRITACGLFSILANMSTKETALNEHLPDASVHLDAVRGLAALTVFLGHGRSVFLSGGLHQFLSGTGGREQAGLPATSSSSSAVPPVGVDVIGSQETIGHEAVIVFFVLSGYFVGGSALRAARKGYFSWGKYLFQRLTRLWTVLLPVLLLGWALDLGGMHLLHSPQNLYNGPLGQDDIMPGLAGRTTLVSFLGNLFFLQGISAPMFGTNVSLWSLSYEFWYYIFFPFLTTVFLASNGWVSRILSGVILLALIPAIGWQISAYFLIWLFGVGVALVPLWLPSHLRRGATAASAVLFALALVLALKYRLNLFLADVILGTAFSVFLWTILHAQNMTVGDGYRRGAQTLSKMSYTLYLVHMPCFVLISAALMPVWQRWPLSPYSALMMLAIYATVFAVAWLMYCCFERNTDLIRNRVLQLMPDRGRDRRMDKEHGRSPATS